MAELPDNNDIPPVSDQEAGDQPHVEPEPSAQEGTQDSANGSLECPICLQPCMHPVELPCRHVFCFLCIKGVAMQGPQGRCAICRASIPYSVLTNPQLKDISQLYKEPKLANGYQWYYESRSGGWWQYDERTMQELERAHSQNLPTCQLLLAGHLYVVDFAQMIQYRSNNRNVSRRIRRGMNLEKRGVAGIRISGNTTGPGSSGGGTSGSPPPQNSGPSSRRRRGNTAASSSVQTTSASGHASTSVAGLNQQLPTLSPQNLSEGHSRELSDSDDESADEDYDSYSEEDDVDDDMEIGEEEEALIGEDSDERDTEDEDEYDTRDGARAPTRRSDRSNSSNNQTPPPPSGTGISNGASTRTYSPNSNGRGSRGARSGRTSGNGGGRSSNGNNGSSSRAAPVGLSDANPATSSQTSASSNVLASLFYNRCNVDNVVSRGNVSNNNICIDPHIIGQVNYPRLGVSQTLNSITASAAGVRITFDRRSQLNQDEYL